MKCNVAMVTVTRYVHCSCGDLAEVALGCKPISL